MMRQRRLGLFVAVLGALATTSYGADFYVATGGNDSNIGAQASPWATIQKAASNLQAGDTVYIRGGVYNESVLCANSGAAGRYIRYTAFQNESVVIDGSGVSVHPEGALFGVEDCNYIRVDSLRVINSSAAGILADHCDNLIIENNSTYNTVSSGIGVWNASNVVIEGNEVELACNDGEQECLTVGVTQSFVIRNNHVHHGGPGTHGGEGIDAKDGSFNGTISHNYVHHIQRLGIYLDAWDKHTHDIQVFRNHVHDNAGDGMSLASEDGGLLENIHIYNNLVYDNKNNGITLGNWGNPVPSHPMRNIFIINNTFYSNGGTEWGGAVSMENPEAQNVVIRNNICSQNLTFQIASDVGVPANSFVADHNLIDGYRSYAGETRGTDFVEGDPKFVQVSSQNFHIGGDSPAIDKGSSTQAPNDDFDGNPRPSGLGFEMGAFEYFSTPGATQTPSQSPTVTVPAPPTATATRTGAPIETPTSTPNESRMPTAVHPEFDADGSGTIDAADLIMLLNDWRRPVQ